MNKKRSILVLGTGNPLVGDDGIGISVGKKVSETIGASFSEGNSFGFEVLSLIEGYKYLIICDSIKVNSISEVGKVFEFFVEDFNNAFHLTSPHTFNLATGLKFGELMGLSMPEKIIIYGIGILTPEEFCEHYSKEIESAEDLITEEICSRAKKWVSKL